MARWISKTFGIDKENGSFRNGEGGREGMNACVWWGDSGLGKDWELGVVRPPLDEAPSSSLGIYPLETFILIPHVDDT